MKKTFLLLLVVIGVLGAMTYLLVRQILAQDFVISGNGEGSNNQVNVQSQKQTTVEQGGKANVTNDVTSNPNTGGNVVGSNTGGAQVVTGNTESKVTIKNNLNTNSANVGGCCPPGETPPTPPKPPVPPTGDGGNPPAGGGSGGGGSAGGGGGGGGGIGGGGGGNPPAGGGGGPQVLGLSATDGPSREESLFYLLGSVCLTSGVMLLKNKLGLGFLG